MKTNSKIQLTTPANSYESLQAAIKGGADSIYFGVGHMHMRARAANHFSLSDLETISTICHKNHIPCYLTLNTLVYDNEISLIKKICRCAQNASISAVIATDLATMIIAQEEGLNVHISTQANISNIEAVRFLSQYGSVMVLARELTLEQITHICSQIEQQKICGPTGQLVAIEIFIHGALCVSIAGKCNMSLALFNHSANRGDCFQPCRRSYTVTDDDTKDQLKIKNRFIMSPRDLCTITFLDRIIESGVKILKIEGRGRSPEYIFKVTKVYREAIDSYFLGTYTKKKINGWLKELQTVYNRGFWEGGYYLGHPLGEWANSYGSQSTLIKIYRGRVLNYYQKSKIAEFLIENDEISIGDTIVVNGPTTGVSEAEVTSIYSDDKPVKIAYRGDKVTIPFPEKIRPNDKLYVLKSRK